MGVNLFTGEKTHETIPSPIHAESQESNPTDEKIKTTLSNRLLKESDREEEKKIIHDGSKKRKECSSSQKMDKVRRLTLEKSEEKKENEEEPLIFIIANQEMQLPPSYKERLARDSDFFRGLFSHPMQETITGNYKIEDIELEEFQKLITLWSGESTVSDQEAVDLLEVSSRLGLVKPIVEILIPTIKNWILTDTGDIETACALSHALFLDSLPSLKSELEIFLVKAYLAANDEAQNLLESIQTLDIRDLNLRESSVDDGKLENLINVCPNLTTLALQRTSITDQSAVQIAKLFKLTTLNVSECRYLTDAAMEPLAKLPNLANLDVSYCWLTDAGLGQIATLPNLYNLNLMGCEQLSGAGLRSVCKPPKLSALNLSGWQKGGLEWIATQLPNLTSLQLSNCRLTDADMRWVAKLTHLTNLDISGCDQVTDAGFKEIAKLLNLTKLNASMCRTDAPGCKVTDNGIAFIADKLTQLTELDLDCRGLTDVAPEHISRLSNLEGLGLNSYAYLTDAGLETISSLTKLTRLDINDCWQLFPNSMQHVIKLTNLTILRLNGCLSLITDEAMKLIPELCHLSILGVGQGGQLTDTGLKHITKLSHLTDLDISCCGSLTDDGYVSIAKLPNLTRLNLYWSPNLTKRSMQLVAENCRQLTSLNLEGCNALKGEDLVEIAPLLPNLIALNLNGTSLAENDFIQIVKHLPKLMYLDIDKCQGVTDLAIKQFAHLLPDLKRLSISSCQNLTDEGIRELMVCRNLRELNMSYCQGLTNTSIGYVIQLPRLISIQIAIFNTPIINSVIQITRQQAIRVKFM